MHGMVHHTSQAGQALSLSKPLPPGPGVHHDVSGSSLPPHKPQPLKGAEVRAQLGAIHRGLLLPGRAGVLPQRGARLVVTDTRTQRLPAGKKRQEGVEERQEKQHSQRKLHSVIARECNSLSKQALTQLV